MICWFRIRGHGFQLTVALCLLVVCESPSQSPPSSSLAKIIEQAADARRAGRPAQALKLYAAAVARHPSWAEGWWDMATLNYELKQFPEARRDFQRVTLLAPKNGPAFVLLGLCEYELRDYQNSLHHLNHGGELGFGQHTELTPVAIFHIAALMNREGDFEDAAQQLLRLVGTGDHSPELVQVLGISTLRMKIVPPEIPPAKLDLVTAAGEAAWTFSAHDVEGAKKLYEQLVEKYPTEPNVHYSYGVYLLESDPKQALTEFQKELEISPTHLAARLQSAFLELQAGDPKQALELGQYVLKTTPRDYRAHLVIGRSLLDLEKPALASKELQLATAIAPEDGESHFYLSKAYRTLGNAPAAAREQAKFESLKQASNRQTSISGWWYFGGQYFNQHRFAECRDAFAKITGQDANDGAAWAMLGFCDYQLRDYKNALDHLSKAAQIGIPSNAAMEPELHYELGLLLNHAGKFDNASQELAWFPSQQSEDPRIPQALGLNALHMTLLPSEIPADKADLVKKAGEAGRAARLGQSEQAKQLYSDLATAFPNESNVHYAYGMFLGKQGQHADAIHEFQRELEINPSQFDAQSLMVFEYLKTGEREKALQAARQAVTLAPDDFLPHNVLGWALLATQDFGNAVREMESAARLAPDMPVTHFSLAQAYKAAGQIADAEREMKVFDKLNQAQHRQTAASP